MILTSDIDWAPEYVLEFFFSELEMYDASWIIFATGNSKILESLDKKKFTIGIHPNFLGCRSMQEVEKVVINLLNLYPNARYSRSHSLITGGPIWSALQKYGIEIDFSLFTPWDQKIIKTQLWNGLQQVSFNWEDDYQMASGRALEDQLDLINKKNQIIFNFHPIHFYLNSSSLTDYNEIKLNFDDRIKIENTHSRNWESKYGVGKLLIDILNLYRSKGPAIENSIETTLKLLPLSKNIF